MNFYYIKFSIRTKNKTNKKSNSISIQRKCENNKIRYYYNFISKNARDDENRL